MGCIMVMAVPIAARATSVPLGRRWQPHRSSRLYSCAGVNLSPKHLLSSKGGILVCYQVKMLTLLLNTPGARANQRVVISRPRWSPLPPDVLLETEKVAGK